jgi:hypothetical protein
LSDLAFVQDGIEGFRRIAGIEVTPSVLSIAMEQQWFAAPKEVDELRYDLCTSSVCS